jgi:N-acetylneuraminic acid mutarotase
VTAANGRLYLIGGIASDGAILDSVEEFDPATGAWRFVAPLPRPLHHTAAAAVEGAIYVTGGFATLAFTPQRRVFRYDIAGDFWTEVASLPTARGALAAVAMDGKVYAVGGVPGGTDLTIYDPATNEWTTAAPMPTPREHLSAAAHDGMLFVAGGRLAGNTPAFERYDPGTNSWTSLAPLPTARSGLAAATLGGRIYVFGGEGNAARADGVFPEVESFDPATGTWRSEPLMPHPRHGIGAAMVGNRIHIPAGGPVQGFGTTNVHDAFAVTITRRRAVRH